MPSGYVQCACRDCFDITIASNDPKDPNFCSECEEAGCELDKECQRPDAYGGDSDEADKRS